MNDKGFTIDSNLPSYIKDGILFLGMAGTGKSETLSETQLILQKNALVEPKSNIYHLYFFPILSLF